MIGNLARRREKTENEAVKLTDPRTRRTPARLAFADHMDRLVAGDRAPSSPERTKMLADADLVAYVLPNLRRCPASRRGGSLPRKGR